MGYLNYNNINEATGSNFSITKNETDVIFTYQEMSHYSDNGYIEEIGASLTGSYSSSLIIGLGIGVIPQWLAVDKSCSVDVIDNDTELIEEINSQGYLDNNITLIEGDINSYNPSKSYDLIVFDIWWDSSEITEEIQNTLTTKYNGHITDNGKISFPLLK